MNKYIVDEQIREDTKKLLDNFLNNKYWEEMIIKKNNNSEPLFFPPLITEPDEADIIRL